MLAGAGQIDLWERDLPIPRKELHERIGPANALYCMPTDRVDRELLAAAPDLRVVSNMAVGVDNIDLAACSERLIPVGHTPDVLTETTADLAFALLLAAARRLIEGVDHVRIGEWGPWNPRLLLGYDVHSSVLGIIGMGRIGRAVARRGRAFGMEILYSSPHAKREEDALGATRRDLAGLLAQSDHVVITAELRPETYRLLDSNAFRLMKPTATLVNVGRGPIVDTDALVNALRTGAIAAAGLDVTDPEPIGADHPLVALPNCVITPHIGSASHRSRDAMAELAARNTLAGLAGEALEACANPVVYS
jgi:glyoxylate reductase